MKKQKRFELELAEYRHQMFVASVKFQLWINEQRERTEGPNYFLKGR